MERRRIKELSAELRKALIAWGHLHLPWEQGVRTKGVELGLPPTLSRALNLVPGSIRRATETLGLRRWNKEGSFVEEPDWAREAQLKEVEAWTIWLRGFIEHVGPKEARDLLLRHQDAIRACFSRPHRGVMQEHTPTKKASRKANRRRA